MFQQEKNRHLTLAMIFVFAFFIISFVPKTTFARVQFGGGSTDDTAKEIILPKLTGLKADTITTDTIKITWTPDPDYGAIQVAYSDTNKVPEFPTTQEWSVPHDNNNPIISIEKLTPDTLYYIRIRSVKNEVSTSHAGLDQYYGEPSDVIQVRTLSDKPVKEDPPADSDPDTSPANTAEKEVFTVGAYVYSISGDQAVVTSVKSNAAAKFTIPEKVTIKERSLPVTSIAPNAFRDMKNLNSITIGKNVKKIGRNAFCGCKKLKKIIIKTTKLTKKSIGANAFKGICKKAVVKCPKTKKKAYKKILLKKGMKKTMTFK